MIRYTVDLGSPAGPAIVAAAEILRRDGIVAFPTDTLYGLAADPRSDRAAARLFAIKGRAAGTAVPLIAADLAQAESAGALGLLERRLAASFWPGPLSIVVPASSSLSAGLRAEDGTVAVRVPAHGVARALAYAFGGCVTATSANLSGAPPAWTGDQVEEALGASIDAIVDAGPAPGGAPSTIVRVVEGRPVLVRAGAIAWERVLESLQ